MQEALQARRDASRELRVGTCAPAPLWRLVPAIAEREPNLVVMPEMLPLKTGTGAPVRPPRLRMIGGRHIVPLTDDDVHVQFSLVAVDRPAFRFRDLMIWLEKRLAFES